MTTHTELCCIAADWLKRGAVFVDCMGARRRCKCTLVAVEVTTWDPEQPDAIGWVSDRSILVECKTSRSDFLSDKRKPFRIVGGMGDYRYYMAPKGIIGASDLPDGWGLIEVSDAGKCRCVVPATKQPDTNFDGERRLLISVTHRLAPQDNYAPKTVYGSRATRRASK